MEEALRAKLLANPAIAALAKAVAWIDRPDASLLPAITLQQVGPGRSYTHSGANDLTDPLVQFDLWGTSQWQVVQLERLVTAEMETPGTISGVEFGTAFLEAQNDFDPEDIDGGDKVYRRVADWRVFNTPTA